MNQAKHYWLIQEIQDDRRLFVSALPSKTSRTEIVRLLQRLAARHLSAEEIVNASRVKRAATYCRRLEVCNADDDETLLVEGTTRCTARICSEFEYVELKGAPPRGSRNEPHDTPAR